jgi:hypothetical protein
MSSITIRLPKTEKDAFVETVSNRYLSTTAVLRMLINKVNTDTDNTLDFLFFNKDEKEE